MSTESDFLTLLCSKTWSSNKDNTLNNPQYNKLPQTDWRYDLIQNNSGYYPPDNVNIEISDQTFVRDGYKAPNGKETDDVYIPDSAVYTFTMKVTGDDFQGKAALNAARFTVYGDLAISTPIVTDKASGVSVVIVVKIKDFGKNRLIMVNELIWSVQYQGGSPGSQEFYDIQKWYCCGYP